jgi:hypothetical protein
VCRGGFRSSGSTGIRFSPSACCPRCRCRLRGNRLVTRTGAGLGNMESKGSGAPHLRALTVLPAGTPRQLRAMPLPAGSFGGSRCLAANALLIRRLYASRRDGWGRAFAGGETPRSHLGVAPAAGTGRESSARGRAPQAAVLSDGAALLRRRGACSSGCGCRAEEHGRNRRAMSHRLLFRCWARLMATIRRRGGRAAVGEHPQASHLRHIDRTNNQGVPWYWMHPVRSRHVEAAASSSTTRCTSLNESARQTALSSEVLRFRTSTKPLFVFGCRLGSADLQRLELPQMPGSFGSRH